MHYCGFVHAYNFMPKFHLAVTIYLSQYADLPPEGEVTVGMVLAASGRKLHTTLKVALQPVKKIQKLLILVNT